MVAIDRLSKAALTRSLLYWISLDLIFQGIAFECNRLIGTEARIELPLLSPLPFFFSLYLNFAIIEINPVGWKISFFYSPLSALRVLSIYEREFIY